MNEVSKAGGEPNAASRQLHVAIYTRYWKIGGIERVIAYMVKALGSSGYRFSIITEDPPSPEAQFDLGPETPVYSRRLTPFTSDVEEELRELILRINPDVAVGMGSSRAIYKVARALRGTPIPVIHSEHNTPEHILESLHYSDEFLTALRNSCDFLHVLSGDFAAQAPRPERVRVIGNPVIRQSRICDVRNSLEPTKPNTILFVGRMDMKQKQPQIAVEAFALLAKRFLGWRFALYGDDWKGGRRRLEKLISMRGVEDQVMLFGHEDNVEDLYLNSKILAFPSAFEGWGLSASEALSYGLPVVAFDQCAGVNRLVKDNVNGILVPGSVHDVDAFARALERLMSNEKLRVELGANGPATMSEYALPDFARKWDDLYKDAAALKGRNLLSNLSPMEDHYMQIVTSGLIFDRNAGAMKAAQDLRHELRMFGGLDSGGFLRGVLRLVSRAIERTLAKVILSPKLFKKYQRQRQAFFSDSRHSWLVKYGRRFP